MKLQFLIKIRFLESTLKTIIYKRLKGVNQIPLYKKFKKYEPGIVTWVAVLQ